jgi:hypothetical protein
LAEHVFVTFKLTWVKSGPVGFEKNVPYIKNNNVPNDYYLALVGLKRTNRKIGKTVSLYQWELLKKIPCLGTFFTQSVNVGLSNSLF